ncbi:MAG: hypothetical protein E6Q95_01135 [Chitinophagaceae bacterium]|nr:MAG: hypothetical protein E6Q95_01135 [Chitinophagaceae bacterium]
MNETVMAKIKQPPQALPYLLFKYTKALFSALGIFILLDLYRLFTQENYNIKRFYFSIGLFVLVTLFLALKEYFFLFYQLDNTNIIIHNGLVKKSKTIIPIKNIQNINTKSNWIQKILGITTIIIDTAGSNKEEAEFMIKQKDLPVFKNSLLNNNSSTDGITQEDKPNAINTYHTIFETQTTDILKLGFSANHLETMLVVAGFIFSQMNELEKFFKEGVHQATDTASNFVAQSLQTIWGILLIVFMVLVFTILISIFRSLLKYFDYKIQKTNHGFFIQYGLFSTIEKIIPQHKIQWVSWTANALRSQLKLYEFKFLISGEEDIKNKLKAHVPITQEALLAQLTKDYLPINSFHLEQKIQIQKPYIFIQLLLKIIPIFIILFILGYFLNAELLYFLLIPFYWGLKIILKQRNSYLQYNETGVLLHLKSFGKKIILLRWDKLQSVSLQQSGFQKRAQLATLILHTSAGNIHFPYFKKQEAKNMYNLALFKIETSNWS